MVSALLGESLLQPSLCGWLGCLLPPEARGGQSPQTELQGARHTLWEWHTQALEQEAGECRLWVRPGKSPEAPFPSSHLESCLHESSEGSEPKSLSSELLSVGTHGNPKKGSVQGPSPGDWAYKKVGVVWGGETGETGRAPEVRGAQLTGRQARREVGRASQGQQASSSAAGVSGQARPAFSRVRVPGRGGNHGWDT